MQAWYVAEFNSCIIVRADDISDALAQAKEHPLLKGKRIRVIRHATPDEIELHETMPQRLEELTRRA